MNRPECISGSIAGRPIPELHGQSHVGVEIEKSQHMRLNPRFKAFHRIRRFLNRTVVNLDVETDHRYLVTDLGIVAHNANVLCVFPKQVGGTADAPQFASFQDAQRSALAWLEKRGFTTGEVTTGKFGDAAGLPNGLKGPGNVGYRIEFDARSGAHINVFAGKLKGPHFLFPGNQNAVFAILQQLFHG